MIINSRFGWCCIALPFLATALPAQWRSLSASGEARVVYDAARRRAVAFGADGGTWEWQGAQRLHRNAEGPGQRTGAAMAFDQARNQVVLFGGEQLSSFSTFGDTWIWDGVTWSQPFLVITPPRRVDGCMAFDAGRGRAVMFGGVDLFAAVPADVWEFDGSQWQRIPFLAPGPDMSLPCAMAYDPVRGEVVHVMLGQSNPQTWSWNGSRWLLVTSGGPFALSTPCGMAFDPVRARLVLLAAVVGGGQIWELQGNSWTAGPLVPGLTMTRASLFFDPTVNATVIQGGCLPGTNEANRSIWSWDGTTARQLAPALGPVRRGNFASAYDPLRARTILFGGGPTGAERNDLWEWDGQDWTQRSVAAGPGPREIAAACFDGTRGAVMVFGGRSSSSALGDLWALDGTGWTRLQPATAPPPSFGAAMVWDPQRGRVLLFGGTDGTVASDATWEWDGSTWTQRHPAISPGPRYQHAMAYDPVRNRTVLYGGRGAGDDTWEWNGNDWAQVNTAQTPGVRFGNGMVFDPVAGCIVMMSLNGGTSISLHNEVWDYDGTNWAIVETVSGRNFGSRSLLWDSGRGRLQFLDGEFVRERSPTPADVAVFGQGCGTPAPRILAHARPRIGEPAFGAELWTSANLPVAFVAGWSAASTPLGNGCTLLVQPLGSVFGLADGQGFSPLPLPLPATAALRGLGIQFQGAVLDPASPGGFAVSARLRGVLGD